MKLRKNKALFLKTDFGLTKAWDPRLRSHSYDDCSVESDSYDSSERAPNSSFSMSSSSQRVNSRSFARAKMIRIPRCLAVSQ